MATRRKPTPAVEPPPPPPEPVRVSKAKARAPAPKKSAPSLKDVIDRHNTITLELAFVDALFETVSENFSHHDGLEPRSLVVTSDGRRVPEVVITSVMARVRDAIQSPLVKELDELKKVTL